jgi:DNA-nicking Smr family endonuclease
VAQFIAECRDRDLRCVRIVHGKGNGSPNSGPVLKGLLDGWLRRRRDVLAYVSARPVDGGTGAVYVLLRWA